MHQGILLKVLARSVAEARQAAQSALEDSCSEGRWDYVDGKVEHLAKDFLTTDGRKFSSWEEVEEYYKKETRDSIERRAKMIGEILTAPLAEEFMTRADALLFININNRSLKETAEKILKSGKDAQVPKTFKELSDAVVKKVVDTARRSGMLGYYLNSIRDLEVCLEFPEDKLAVNTIDSYFALINTDKNARLKTFYFWGSRHH